MRGNKNILAIIPARGGSKSIPLKNIKKLGNKPLISYPIELAKSIDKINKVVVSTDSKEIAKIAKKYGAEIPFIRPPELAKDNTPTLPVLQHCVKFLEKKQKYKADIILLLYPTCPFLKKETVEKAIKILTEKKCNTVVSIEKDNGRFWKYSKLRNKYVLFYPKKRINRQYYKPLFKENGAIYFSKYNVLMKKRKIIDEKSTKFILMEPEEMVDIDTPQDWKKAGKLLAKENKEVYFRLATEEDMKDLYNWRNDKLTRKLSFDTKKITLQEHKKWFKKSMTNKKRQIFIILNVEGRKIGQIRFDKTKKRAEISIAIAPNYRGQGYGTKSLAQGCETYLNNFEVDFIIANIKKDNIPSIKAFEKAGFEKHKEHSDKLEYRYYKK